MKYSSLIPFILLLGCSHLQKEEQEPLTFFVYSTDFFSAVDSGGQKELTTKFNEILVALGKKGRGGRVGMGFVFPYLAWTQGSGAGPYKISSGITKYHELFIETAHKMNIPVLVQFNGAVWHSPSSQSAFLSYWKTFRGGKYLSRYKDGKVNHSIKQTGTIPKSEIRKHLDADPYGEERENSLFLTLSPHASEFRKARIQPLKTALHFWKELDKKYPGVIQAFTTDSEVSTFSCRDQAGSPLEIPIGYEVWNTKPFCQENHIKNCKDFFRLKKWDYSIPLHYKWYLFRSRNHLQFVQDTVNAIRDYFPHRPIYTHQISIRDKDITLKHHKNRDFASPQWTAFAKKASPGFTLYTYAGDSRGDKKQFIDEVSEKLRGQRWGILEFNTARGFKGTRDDLAKFTYGFMRYAYKKGVRVIAPLSWTSNSLDIGIRGTGVADGIKEFVVHGPDIPVLFGFSVKR